MAARDAQTARGESCDHRTVRLFDHTAGSGDGDRYSVRELRDGLDNIVVGKAVNWMTRNSHLDTPLNAGVVVVGSAARDRPLLTGDCQSRQVFWMCG
jgi:hypothetical protein